MHLSCVNGTFIRICVKYMYIYRMKDVWFNDTNLPQSPDIIIFSNNKNKYPIHYNTCTQGTHRSHLGFISKCHIIRLGVKTPIIGRL